MKDSLSVVVDTSTNEDVIIGIQSGYSGRWSNSVVVWPGVRASIIRKAARLICIDEKLIHWKIFCAISCS
jgi:hypothetical protein